MSSHPTAGVRLPFDPTITAVLDKRPFVQRMIVRLNISGQIYCATKHLALKIPGLSGFIVTITSAPV